jgi:hypothetical protein
MSRFRCSRCPSLRLLVVALVCMSPVAASAGALDGKTVYVSAANGWRWNGAAWVTGLGTQNGILGDFLTAELVDELLLDELERMGARAVALREPDRNPERVYVGSGAALVEGAVTELACADPGFGGAVSIDGTANPFQGGSARLMAASASENGRVVWPIAVPASGLYSVSVSYAAGPDRASDARYAVWHAGGVTVVRLDQRRRGARWVRLGTFWLDAGAPVTRASVALSSYSADPGARLSFDAVKVGGGQEPLGASAPARPLFEFGAAVHAHLSGAPSTVFESELLARPRLAAWDHVAGEDAVFVAVQTWSYASESARGSSGLVYGPSVGTPGPIGDSTGTTGSVELLAAVHGELVADLRAGWEAGWADRGQGSRDVAELRPSENGDMPGILLQLANTGATADAAALADPRFARIAARAIAQGIARYFAARDGVALVLPPEPPVAVRTFHDAAGAVFAAWRPPLADPAGGDAPTSYLVQVSEDGHAFDSGVQVVGTTTGLPVAVGDARYVRVQALNAGGASPPSEVVGARRAALGRPTVLVVNGFDRLDGYLVPVEQLGALGLGAVRRLALERMNDRSYAARHGAALAAAGFSFDGTSDEAVDLGDVALGVYPAVDWFVGRQGGKDDVFSPAARGALASYLGAGGALFASGEDMGYALDPAGDATTRAFLAGTLHAEYAHDDAATYATSSLGGAFTGLAPLDFGDAGTGSYDAPYPDVWAATTGTALLTYQGGTGGVAAVAWEDAGARGVLFGFPFETISGAVARAEVMRRVMAQLAVAEPAPPPAPPSAPGGGCAGCGAAGAGGGWLAVAASLAAVLVRRRPARGG